MPRGWNNEFQVPKEICKALPKARDAKDIDLRAAR